MQKRTYIQNIVTFGKKSEKTANNMKIGEKLKSVRVSKGYSAEQIAEKAGIDISTYRRYERNETSPSIEKLELIANANEVTLFNLLPDSIMQTNHNQSGGIAFSAYQSTITMLSDKIIENYEKRISEHIQEIEFLREQFANATQKNA